MSDRAAGVIAIFGPTGVGKTATAIALADLLRVGGEDPVAVSADSMQVYAGLERLTGAATPAEREALEHRLIGFQDPTEAFSAGQYAELAHEAIDQAIEQERTPIVVGGTGLYLQAALCDLDLRPAVPQSVRAAVRGRLESEGPAALHAELRAQAPRTAASILPTDARRIVRALELIAIGEPPPPGSEDSRLWTARLRRPTTLFGLTMEREQLYARIERRVDAIVAAGAADEVAAVEASGPAHTPRQALGYRHLLRGDVEAMRRDTLRYAKRQLAWMRRLEGVATIDTTNRDPADVSAQMRLSLPQPSGEA